MEQKAQKKKVVTKGQYVGYLAKKTGLTSFGNTLCFFGVMGMILAGLGGTCLSISVTVSNFYLHYGILPEIYQLGTILIISIAIFTVCWMAFYVGRDILSDSRKLDPVVPLSRHTAHLLSQEETLVRGSQQPSQQAETLLRAAQAEETPPEQLLRPEQGSQS